MAAFTAQPAEKHAHQHGGIEPVGLGALVLARDRDAGRMDDVGLNALPSEPPRQPEPVTPSLERNGDARDGATAPGCLVTPAMQQAEQSRFVRCDLLQRLSLDPRNGPGDQPARLAQLDDGNQAAVLFKGVEGSAQIVCSGHRALHRRW